MWVRGQMRAAHRRAADLIHFPECALSGYAGRDRRSLETLHWGLLRAATESILALARELKVWVAVGSTHRLSDSHRPHNSVYVIDPTGRIADRYDKRFCPRRDLEHYSPGDHPVTFEVKGVTCGLLICNDICSPELYCQYSQLGVRLMLHSFYNAGEEVGSLHPHILPITADAYAKAHNMSISISNSSAGEGRPSRFIRPNGLLGAQLAPSRPGLVVSAVDPRWSYYDPIVRSRLDTIDHRMPDGVVVDDQRSKDRTCY